MNIRILKKVVMVGFTSVVGLIFLLAGLNLITLTSNLMLYSGVALILLAIFFFFKD